MLLAEIRTHAHSWRSSHHRACACPNGSRRTINLSLSAFSPLVHHRLPSQLCGCRLPRRCGVDRQFRCAGFQYRGHRARPGQSSLAFIVRSLGERLPTRRHAQSGGIDSGRRGAAFKARDASRKRTTSSALSTTGSLLGSPAHVHRRCAPATLPGRVSRRRKTRRPRDPEIPVATR